MMSASQFSTSFALVHWRIVLTGTMRRLTLAAGRQLYIEAVGVLTLTIRKNTLTLWTTSTDLDVIGVSPSDVTSEEGQ